MTIVNRVAFMRRIRKFFILTVVMLISFTVGRYYQNNAKKTVEWEQVEAYPEIINSCVTPNAEEAERYNLAVAVLENTGEMGKFGRISSLDIGAHRFLSAGIYRNTDKTSVAICAPARIYERASEAITKYKGFAGRLEEYQLKLASKLPNPSSYIVEAVANSAFNDTPQESEFFKQKDIRPYARSVLAGFNGQLSAYGNQAYQQISSHDSLGTGAAQVAVASGYSDTLPRVEGLMKELLSSVPKDEVITWKTRNRLYELAYAINFAGKNSRQYTAPIKDLMSRKVQSWAPPFGMLELNPKRMCRVLENIEGKAALYNYTYCTDDKIPFEQ